MKDEQNKIDTVSSSTQSPPPASEDINSHWHGVVRRRSFLKGLGMAGATLLPASALLMTKAKAQQEDSNRSGDRSGSLTRGDAAILRFLGAAEILESDLWIQYWELGGTQDNEFATATGGNPRYTEALQILDGDQPQYIHDNTDDEISHAAFIRAYLASRGASSAELDLLNGPHFRTLPGSTATGSSGKKRLTNLMNLNVDTSFWSRYRIDNENPDLDPNFKFPQAVEINNRTAIPRNDDDLVGPALIAPFDVPDHLKAIAFTAGFHFAFIEVGGTSLYPSLAQRVSSPEVLRILLSIGPTETAHFQTWQDKAGNAPPLTDPTNGLVFPDLNSPPFGGEDFQTNLIMPEPCPFLSRNFP